MKCRKCKYYIKEQDREYYIVHCITSHGVLKSIFEHEIPDADWETIELLLKEHRVTGQASSEKLFGKKSTRKII